MCFEMSLTYCCYVKLEIIQVALCMQKVLCVLGIYCVNRSCAIFHIFSALCVKSVQQNIKQCTHKPFDFSISFNCSLIVL